MREDGVLLDVAVAIDALEAGREPIGKGKVDSLVEVEAVIEARVVAAREGDDELVRALIAGDDADTVLLETSRTHESDELEHEIGLLVEELGGGKLHGSLELLVVGAGNAVPGLGVAPVVVVDAAGSQKGQSHGTESMLRGRPTCRCNDPPCARRRWKRPCRRRSKEWSCPRCPT